MTMELAFKHPQSWGYPAGLGSAITQLMEKQNIFMYATNFDGTNIYVKPNFGLKGFWSVCDNEGELQCWRVNTETSFDVGLADLRGLETHTFALVVVVRMIAGFRGEEVDYRWRPTDGQGGNA
jgi:hypothetical protein